MFFGSLHFRLEAFSIMSKTTCQFIKVHFSFHSTPRTDPGASVIDRDPVHRGVIGIITIIKRCPVIGHGKSLISFPGSLRVLFPFVDKYRKGLKDFLISQDLNRTGSHREHLQEHSQNHLHRTRRYFLTPVCSCLSLSDPESLHPA